jgi:hypothetical protein
VNEVLGARPGVARLAQVVCGPDEDWCRVTIEVTDLAAFAPLLERLSEPGTGFAGDATSMRLEGIPDGGPPFTVAFTLYWADEDEAPAQDAP